MEVDMDSRFYNLKLDRKTFQIHAMKLLSIVLGAVVLIQSIIIFNMYKNHKIVFLPPFNATQEFSIAGKKLSKEYMTQIGKYISSSIYTISPANAQEQLYSLLPLFSADSYHKYKAHFNKMAKDLHENELSHVFYFSNVKIDKPNVLTIVGQRKSIIGNKIVSYKNMSINVNYRVNDRSKFEIIELGKTK
jgi:type IV conjugative transfer system protein TraE